ncbi:MAG: IMP cyclohydrolase [halophilic archaeon J07HX5]|nr:MAG: IMP cyclohydrolase [halophilic archaeon J07HX5]
MYVGRFVVVAPRVGAYRVSSRSFPNRKATDHGDRVSIVPTAAAPNSDNPYISYHCIQRTDSGVVLGNGAHVDPIAEKLARGYPARDALVTALLTLDFEKDEYDTPRIAGVVGTRPSSDGASSQTPVAHIGIVRRDGLQVDRVTEPTLVATYERTTPEPFGLEADEAAAAARAVYEHPFDHRVCAAGVVVDDGVETAVING